MNIKSMHEMLGTQVAVCLAIILLGVGGMSASAIAAAKISETASSVSLPKPVLWITFDNTKSDQSGWPTTHNVSFGDGASFDTSVPNTTAGAASLRLTESGSVSVANPADVNLNSGHPFTIAVWFVTPNSSSWPTMLIKQPDGWVCETHHRAAFQISPEGHLHYDVSCIKGLDSRATVNDGRWHHGVVVYTGTRYQLYLDGEPDSQDSFDGCNEGERSEPPWTLTVGFNFGGNIDELVFWNESLSAEQVQSVFTHGVSVGPVAIVRQPADVTVKKGSVAKFTVEATSRLPGASLSYQWQKNGVDIEKANSATYSTPPVTPKNNGSTFRCVITVDGSRVTSRDVSLTVGE